MRKKYQKYEINMFLEMRKWNEMFHEILLGRLQVFTKTGRRQLEDCPEASFAVASWHLVDICTRLILKLGFIFQIYSTPNLKLWGQHCILYKRRRAAIALWGKLKKWDKNSQQTIYFSMDFNQFYKVSCGIWRWRHVSSYQVLCKRFNCVSLCTLTQ